MILRSIWIKNNTALPLTFLGIEISPNTMEDFSYESDLSLQTDASLITALLAGDISVGDGVTFAVPIDSLTALRYPRISPALVSATNIPQHILNEILYRTNGPIIQTFGHTQKNIQFPIVGREDTAYTCSPTSDITVSHTGYYKVTSSIGVHGIHDHDYLEVGIYHGSSLVLGSLGAIGKMGDHSHTLHSTILVTSLVKLAANDTFSIKATVKNHKGKHPSKIDTVADYCSLMVEKI